MSTKKGGRGGGGRLQVWHKGKRESIGITWWNPDVQNQWRKRRRKRRRMKAPTMAQRQMDECWGPKHGIMEHECTKPVEEEEEEGSSHGMRTKRRALGPRASHGEPICAKPMEEEEEEGSNHGTNAKRRTLGLRAWHGGTQMCKISGGRGGGRLQPQHKGKEESIGTQCVT